MNKENPNYRTYIRILEEELVPAMGCTEPIALAYCRGEGPGGSGRDARSGGHRCQRQHHQEREKRDCSQYQPHEGDSRSGGSRNRGRRRIPGAGGHRGRVPGEDRPNAHLSGEHPHAPWSTSTTV